MKKYCIISFIVLIVTCCMVVAALGNRTSLSQTTSKYTLSADEARLYGDLSHSFSRSRELNEETVTSIYSAAFSGYKQEFARFEEARDKEDILTSMKKRADYASKSSEYDTYQKAVSAQLSKMMDWSSVIDDGIIKSEALKTMILSREIPADHPLLDYTEAARHYWGLEEMYHWEQWCYRAVQLSRLDECLKNHAAGPYATPEKMDLKRKRTSAIIILEALEKRVNAELQ